MSISETDFIEAVQHAIDANPRAGNKWDQLEEIFAGNGLRGNGALNNGGGADRTTRVRQLSTSKVHAGYSDRNVAKHSVFVIGGDTIEEYDRDRDKYLEKIEEALINEHENCESCLILVAITGFPVSPVRLVKKTEQPLGMPYEAWWPSLHVSTLIRGDGEKKSAIAAPSSSGPIIGANIIFFGPPGTGKSTEVKRSVSSAPMFRTQFHPETSNADLIGSYRPVVGHEIESTNNILGHDGVSVPRPVNYFAFVPGPLTDALECAFGQKSDPLKPDHVFLVIEEINRGDCAAIFGDIFQLLDRDDSGRSEYGITPKPELLAYFTSKGVDFDIADDGKLYLPSNLSLRATMNTSDQSLYPMDSAFKRRWQWHACSIDFNQLLSYTTSRPFLDDGKIKWDWIGLIININKCIVQDRMEDKQLGPWFIKPSSDGSISFNDFLNKCLFYLWHDVFKDEQLSDISPFKSDGPEVFGEVQSKMQDNGLSSGFKTAILDNLAPEVAPPPPPTLAEEDLAAEAVAKSDAAAETDTPLSQSGIA